MKRSFFFSLLLLTGAAASAQLQTKTQCATFVIDVVDGKVNDVHPDFTPAQIRAKLPCVSSEDPESSKCGGAIHYRDQDITFFPARDYIEVGPGFKGRSTVPLLGGKRGTFYKYLGAPKLKDTDWDAFETQYGCLILYYNAAGKVRLIRFSTKSTDDIHLCE